MKNWIFIAMNEQWLFTLCVKSTIMWRVVRSKQALNFRFFIVKPWLSYHYRSNDIKLNENFLNISSSYGVLLFVYLEILFFHAVVFCCWARVIEIQILMQSVIAQSLHDIFSRNLFSNLYTVNHTANLNNIVSKTNYRF